MTEYVYKVTRTRKNPQYYQSAVETRVVSAKSLAAMKPLNDPKVVKVLRSECNWEDITEQITGEKDD